MMQRSLGPFFASRPFPRLAGLSEPSLRREPSDDRAGPARPADGSRPRERSSGSGSAWTSPHGTV